MSLEQVGALREQLFDAGFRPVPVLNGDKRPLGKEWTDQARLNPPACVRLGPVAHALSTGILCDGLRAIDYDIDDKDIAAQCRAIAAEMFGEAPMRFRRNSPRFLVLYRAVEGAPPKVSLAGKHGKIEALGRGQQFVAFGSHPSGAELEWFPDAPGAEKLDTLPAISEEQLFAFFERCAPIIGADPPTRLNGQDHGTAPAEGSALEIAASLAAAPNNGPTDWEHWNKVGMAVWRSCGGAAWGFELWNDWSSRHPSYNTDATRERWNHYPTSPPTQTGLGKLLRMAREAPKVEEPPPLPEPDPPEAFEASPLSWAEMESVGPREFIYAHFLIRRFITVLGAPGGTGKTAYSFAVALSIATFTELLGEKVHENGNVWIYNLEDPKQELLRRFRAACLRYNIGQSDVEGRIYLDSGRDRPLVIAERTKDGGIVAMPVVQQLIAELKRRNIRVLIIDPFVRSHRLEENVNEQIDFAASLWAQVADGADCAVLLVHHFRKGGGSGDVAAFRGASALTDAARAALSMAAMTEDESKRFGISEDERWQYVRLDNAKLNLAPPPESATWLRLVGEDLGNGTDQRPADKVQTVERWEPPSAWDGMPWTMVVRILDKIDAGPEPGEFYSLRPQAKERWAGVVLMADACRTDVQAKSILKEWTKNGVLEEGQYSSPKQKGALTGCIRPNRARVEEMRRNVSAAIPGSDE